MVEQVLALLFVADRPASVTSLSEALQAPEPMVREALLSLGAKLDSSGPLQLVSIAGGYQLATKAAFAEVVARFLNPQKQRMSRSLMEVLAVVAYRQPVTLAEVEDVRGVQSDYGIRTLQERRLIKEVGRKATPGRPVLYGTTQQFLHQFQMTGLDDLPQLQLTLGGATAPALAMTLPGMD